eukprot:8949683-Lingulodinium_polyedra.AAC.1
MRVASCASRARLSAPHHLRGTSVLRRQPGDSLGERRDSPRHLPVPLGLLIAQPALRAPGGGWPRRRGSPAD